MSSHPCSLFSTLLNPKVCRSAWGKIPVTPYFSTFNENAWATTNMIPFCMKIKIPMRSSQGSLYFDEWLQAATPEARWRIKSGTVLHCVTNGAKRCEKRLNTFVSTHKWAPLLKDVCFLPRGAAHVFYLNLALKCLPSARFAFQICARKAAPGSACTIHSLKVQPFAK